MYKIEVKNPLIAKLQAESSKLSFVFFGTPDLVIPILDELEKNNLLPSLIVTGLDVKKGRKMLITKPAPKVWAEARNIPVLQPEKIDAEFIENFKNNFDLGVAVAYGKILPKSLLDIPKFGMINVHYSLLPKYRGATPVESAILNGESETGVSIQKMVFELDAGDVIDEEKTEIRTNEKALELRARLNDIAKKILPGTISKIVDGKATFKKQDASLATHCGKIKKEDGLINLEEDPLLNYRKFRAYFGWPGSYFFVSSDGKNIRVKITDADFTDNKFIVKKVIPEGKNETDYQSFLKGLK